MILQFMNWMEQIINLKNKVVNEVVTNEVATNKVATRRKKRK